MLDSGLFGYSREVADSGCAAGDFDCVEEEPIDGSGLAELVQDAADFLAENVLVEANVESASASSVTYRLRPETLCDGSASETDPAPAPGRAATWRRRTPRATTAPGSSRTSRCGWW